VHTLGRFTFGALNCWENWMPLPRAALYALGEDLHLALWPGSARNTRDVTRFLAVESRSYVVSVSGLMRLSDVASRIPHAEANRAASPDVLADGGSCIATPGGAWLIEPCVGEERLLVTTMDHSEVRRERQNFDPAGHHARPDVTRLVVNRERQSTILVEDGR
jgi:nitrilase